MWITLEIEGWDWARIVRRVVKVVLPVVGWPVIISDGMFKGKRETRSNDERQERARRESGERRACRGELHLNFNVNFVEAEEGQTERREREGYNKSFGRDRQRAL